MMLRWSGLTTVTHRLISGPPLTSVALPLLEMGKLAGKLLVAAVRGAPAEAKIHRAPCYLVQRESCGSAL